MSLLTIRAICNLKDCLICPNSDVFFVSLDENTTIQSSNSVLPQVFIIFFTPCIKQYGPSLNCFSDEIWIAYPEHEPMMIADGVICQQKAEGCLKLAFITGSVCEQTPSIYWPIISYFYCLFVFIVHLAASIMAASRPRLHLLPTISAHIFYFKLLLDYLCALQLPNHNKWAA